MFKINDYFYYILLLFTIFKVDAAIYTVTSTNDTYTSGTLRYYIGTASSGDTIVFSNSLAGQTINLTSQLYIGVSNLTIQGLVLSGSNQITINGSGISSGNTFFIGNSSCTITNLNIIGNNSGNAVYINSSNSIVSNNTISGNSNSGIFINGTNNSISSNTITNNNASNGGGGIFINLNSNTITNNIVTNNTSSNNGGGGIFVSSSNNTLTGNTVSNNTTTNTAGGGGIYITGSNNILSNNTISGNNASNSSVNGGGGVYINAFNNTLQNNIISNNISGYDGGGIYINSYNNKILNNVINGNTATQENGGGGIAVANGSGQYNSILSNNIYDNTQGGIFLIDGGNHYQAAPNLISASFSGNSITVSGIAPAAASGGGTMLIQFFLNDANNSINEGQQYISGADVIVSANAAFTATFTLPTTALTPPYYISATATNNNGSYTSSNLGDTSGFPNTSLPITCTSLTVLLNPTSYDLLCPVIINPRDNLCIGSTIDILAVVSGGSGNYTYQWSGPNGFSSTSNPIIINNATTQNSGTYSVIVTDSLYGCTGNASTEVTVDSQIIVNVSATPAVVCSNSNVILSAQVTGGSGSYSYSWSGPNGFVSTANPVTISNVTSANAGTYTVNVVDSNNCSASGSTIVTVNSNVNVFVSPSQLTVCYDDTINLDAQVTGGSGSYSYSWAGPNGFTAVSSSISVSNATLLNMGTYTVTVTDSNGCTGTATSTVIVNFQLTSLISPSQQSICSSGIINLTAQATGGSGGYSYIWTGPNGFTSTSNPISISNANISNSGTYTVTITDSNLCTSTSSANVNVLPEITVSITPSFSNICYDGAISLTAQATGGSNVYNSYIWTGPNGFSGIGNPISIPNATTSNTGTYTVVVIDSAGCMGTGNASVVVGSEINLSVVSTQPTVCPGGTINLTAQVTGGAGGYSYNWTGPNGFTSTLNPVNIPNVSQANSGIYQVTVTDANNCVEIGSIDIAVSTPVIVEVTPSQLTVCVGESIELLANVSGGSGIYSYQWLGPNGYSSTNNPINISSATLLNSGTYTVTVTDSNGCIGTDVSSINVNPALSVDIVSNQTIFCANSTINLTAQVSGGSGVYNYGWTGPNGYSSTGTSVNIPNVTPLNGGTYQLTVTDSNGCQASSSISIGVDSEIIVAVTPSMSNICYGSTINLTAQVTGGAGGYNYSWVGPNDFTSTSNPIIIPNATNANTGTYTVTVTDSNECFSTDTASISVGSELNLSVQPSSIVLCPGSDLNITADISGGSGGYNYSWSGPNGFISNLKTITINNVSSSNSGTYNITVTDSSGCAISGSSTVTVNSDLVASIAPNTLDVCVGGTINLSAQVSGGSGIYTYLWSGPSGFYSNNDSISISNVNSVNSGIYQVIVTDSNGCTDTATSTVSVNSLVNVNLNPASVTLSTGDTLSIMSTVTGGTAPYTYSWVGPNGFISNDPNVNIVNTMASNTGTYTLAVTDSNGCYGVSSSEVIVQSTIIVTVTPSSDIICTDNVISLNSNVTGGSGNYNYSWSGPNGFSSVETDINIANATTANSGNYVLTVTDSVILDSGVASSNITVLPEINITLIPAQNPICAGGTISISSSVSGGDGNYTYNWAGPNGFTSSSQSISISNATTLYSGNYTLTVTDSTGCTSQQIINITVYPDLTLSISPSQSIICQGSTITLNSIVSGGSDSYGYNWTGPNGFSSSDSSITISNASMINTGTYILTVTDLLAGCSSIASATVLVLEGINLTVIPLQSTVCSGGSINISTQVSGGSGSYSYSWTGPNDFTSNLPNININNVTSLNSGLYVVQVNDSSGCTASASSSIEVSSVAVSVSPSQLTVCSSDTINLTAQVSGGSGNYSYSWTGPTGFTSTSNSINITNATVANTGVYQVIVTDSIGCTSTSFASVLVNPDINVSIFPSLISTCPGSSLTITAVISGGSGIYDYNWIYPDGTTPNATTSITINNISSENAGVYTLNVIDSNGCQASTTSNIEVYPELEVSISPDELRACVGQRFILTAEPIGGSGIYNSYSWQGPNGFFTNSNPIVIEDATQLNTGSYKVTVIDSNGCQASAISNVTINPAIDVFIVPDQLRICSQGTINLNAIVSGGNAVYNYLWSGPNGFTSNLPSITINNATLLNSGDYTVLVSDVDVDGCVSMASANVLVDLPLNVNIVPNELFSCYGASVTFNSNVTGGIGAYNYNWTGPNGFGSDQPNITLNNVEPSNSGTYTLTVTDSFQCLSTTTAHLTVDPEINVNTFPKNANVCLGGSLNIISVVSGGSGIYSYNWTGPNGFSSNQPNVTLNNVNLSNTGTYTLTVTDARGCSVISSSDVNVLSELTVTVTPDQLLTCTGNTITLVAEVIQRNALYSYSWAGPNGFTADTQSIIIENVTSANTGTYTVTVRDADGCLGVGVANVRVAPTIDVSVRYYNEQSPICSGGTLSLVACPSNGSVPYTFSWTGPNGFNSDYQLIVIDNVSSLNSGTYYVTVTDANGCIGTSSFDVIIEDFSVVISPNVQNICYGNSATFQANVICGSGNYTYNWTGPGIIGATNTQSINVSSTLEPGNYIYTVTVTDMITGNVITTFASLNISKAEVLLTASATQIVEGDMVLLTATPISGIPPFTFIWSDGFVQSGDSAVSRLVTPTSTDNNYSVYVVDAIGCPSDPSVRVVIKFSPGPRSNLSRLIHEKYCSS
ncbi:Immunoglobulin-like repeats containing protein [Candidatus Babela massiliensis]|uniref:Immunoglobulin-like repeats containing protein domain n=1 Tax=Candidatus Babela massiliensis TaxID=673862 RepID=V6DFM6_9BACT|nr:Immunoglobulin-like repeats containing protein [Candidatus Babela massiliensis]CDK30397.1 Immunoglobulin-like repeats containing protein domain [Candidatus Babela massiliensis]